MTLARFCLVCSILMLLVVGTPEAANITMALATNAPMQAKEVGTPLMKSRQVLCCGASEESFRKIAQAVSFQEFLSTNHFCLCKLIENHLAESEVRLTAAPSWFVPWSSSADSVSGAKTLKNPCFTKPCAYIPAVPSPGPTPPREMKEIGVREMMQQAPIEKTKTQSVNLPRLPMSNLDALRFRSSRMAEPALTGWGRRSLLILSGSTLCLWRQA